MLQITRITVNYAPEEDRIALRVSDREDRKSCLWLIRPLADRLVDSLSRQLMQAAPVAQDKPGAEATESSVGNAVQVYAQLQARLAKRPTPRVRLDADAPQALIREFRVARHKDGAWRLVCVCSDADPAVLIMATAELRQWLEALHRAYLKADWPLTAWPGWFNRPSNSAAA